MSDVVIEKFNETFIKIHCDNSIAYELSQYFTFEVPGAKFIPSVRNKMWDGKIRLFNQSTHHIYYGLREYIEEFCKERRYSVEYNSEFSPERFSLDQTIGLNPHG